MAKRKQKNKTSYGFCIGYEKNNKYVGLGSARVSQSLDEIKDICNELNNVISKRVFVPLEVIVDFTNLNIKYNEKRKQKHKRTTKAVKKQ